jgi:hypothetical protein
MKCSKCCNNLKTLHTCHICGEKQCGICSFKRDNGKRVCQGACHLLSKSQDFVEYDGISYQTVKTCDACPDFALMNSLHVRVWLLKNTKPKGRQREPNPLDGYRGSGIGVNLR